MDDVARDERLQQIEKQPISVECPECGAAWLVHSHRWGQMTEAARYVLKCTTCGLPLSIEKSGRFVIVRCCLTKRRVDVDQILETG